MNPESFPALYQSADSAAAHSQTTYLWLIRVQYLLLTIAATISIWFASSPDLYILYASVVTASTGLLIYLGVRKPEKDWYGCRALAESIKTSTWRYMMRAAPFQDAAGPTAAAIHFSDFLRAILEANRHVRDPISRRPATGNQITDEMNGVRAMPLYERVEKYKEHRILEQRKWYAGKVTWNRRHFLFWIVLCGIVQSAAIVLALLRIKYDHLLIVWPTEPLLVLASSIVGWIQLKKYNELASAYNLTVHEIGILQTGLDTIDSEKKFSDFVNEAERAFSREHTQWVARQTEQAP